LSYGSYPIPPPHNAKQVDGVEWIDGSVQADLPFKRISTLFNVSNFIVCQTNFHVLPFLNKAHHPDPQSLYWRLFQLVEWDIRNRALQLSRLGLFPKVGPVGSFFFLELFSQVNLTLLALATKMFGQDLSKLFKQKYHGNLTLVPRFTPAQTFGLKTLSNPSVEDMKYYLKFGQIAAWPYLK
jgi:TAG lipase/steryl ester hydrolase/phospholipase A2/LPA acyltransferase